jgi:hypothetical protein
LEGLHRGTILIDGYPNDGEAAFFEFAIEGLKLRDLFIAGAAPRCPESEKNPMPLEIF